MEHRPRRAPGAPPPQQLPPSRGGAGGGPAGGGRGGPRVVPPALRRRGAPGPSPASASSGASAASPGRAVGRALFGTEGREPEDFDAAVLVAPSVRPEDNTFLYHARGIVSTGGGILSHAGLIATQFRKPALIVSGEWQREPDGSSTLLYRTPEYREERREVEGVRGRALPRLARARAPAPGRGPRGARRRRGDAARAGAGARRAGPPRRALAARRGGTAPRPRRRPAGGPRAPRAPRACGPPDPQDPRPAPRTPCSPATRPTSCSRARPSRGRPRAATTGRSSSALLLRNRAVGEAARQYLVELVRELRTRHAALVDEARRILPTAASTHEVLARRLDALRLGGPWTRPPRPCAPAASSRPRRRLPVAARHRPPGRSADCGSCAPRGLRELSAAPAHDPRRRHLLRQIERLDLLLGCPGEAERPAGPRAPRRGGRGGASRAARPAGRDRRGGGLRAPPAHRLEGGEPRGGGAARRAASSRPGSSSRTARSRRCSTRPSRAPTLREAVTLRAPSRPSSARGDLDNARKSALIRGLWDGARLPEELAREVAGGLPAPRGRPGRGRASRTNRRGRSSPSAPRPARRTPSSRPGPASSTRSCSSAAKRACSRT